MYYALCEPQKREKKLKMEKWRIWTKSEFFTKFLL